MAAPVIAELPEPPVRSDAPVDFALKADLFLGAFPWLREQINTTAAWVDGQAGTVATHAASAANDAGTASAAGSAATAAAGTASTAATTATNAASAASTAKTAAEAAATRAEDAAQYVEGVVGPLGTAATKDVTTSATDTTAGRVTKVGDFGIGALLLSAAGNLLSNLNDLSLATGIYGYGANATGAPTSGEPGALLVLRFGNAAMRQVAWPMNGAAVVNSEFTRQLRSGPTFDPWVTEFHSGNQLTLGTTPTSALTALGIANLPARVTALEAGEAVTALGDVATSAAQTVDLDIATSKFFSASMNTANTTGTLTLNFKSVPSATTATWHVELIRGGRKTVAFQLDGVTLTPTWAGGAAPTLSNTLNTRDLLMFYRIPGRASVYAMLVDSGAV